jgi:hypothetical protein
MKRSEFVANRLQEVLLDGKWIANTNFKAQIENLDWRQASRKIGQLNSIAALTYHINYYLKGIIHLLENGRLEIHDRFSFDLPPINSENVWRSLVKEFLTNSEKFIGHVKQFSDEKLDEVFVDPKYGTYYRNIEGVIEHSYYHLGQISLLRKLMAEGY